MNSRLKSLANRIRNDLVELERVLQRVENGWEIASRQGDDYYRDSVALNLHGWYSGLERIFVLIAETLDGKLPKGENWHQTLLFYSNRDEQDIQDKNLFSLILSILYIPVKTFAWPTNRASSLFK
jgi:hypothetical protein